MGVRLVPNMKKYFNKIIFTVALMGTIITSSFTLIIICRWAEAAQLTDAEESDQYPQNTPSEENASRERKVPGSSKNK